RIARKYAQDTPRGRYAFSSHRILPVAVQAFKHGDKSWARISSRLWRPVDQPRRKVGQTTVAAGEPEIGAGEASAEQPVVEFRRPLQSEQVPDIERIVKRGGL